MQVFRRLVQALVVAGVLASQALAGPAHNLFEQASFYLSFHYFGFSAVNLKELVKKHQLELETACAQYGDACPYEVARGVIERMMAAVKDEHTYYLSPDAFEAAQAGEQGAGDWPEEPLVGLLLGPVSAAGEALVLEVLTDGPAFQAGVQRFDRVVAVNGTKLPRSAGEALAELTRTGQPLLLSLLRGEQRLELTLTPRPLGTLPFLPYLYEPANAPAGTVVLRIPDFNTFEKVGRKVHELVRVAQTRGYRSMIVDLRDNPGGFLTECTAAVAAFVPDFTLLFESRFERSSAGFEKGAVFDNDPEGVSEYRIDNVARWQGPVATLVNGGTASCGEEFAYHMQLDRRGPVLGERTYGILNTATNYFALIDRSAIAVTTTRALRPDGTPYPPFVTPDVAVPDRLEVLVRTGRDPLMEAAFTSVMAR